MKWMNWAKALQAISQTGLHFSKDKFDRERYEQVGNIAMEMLAQGTSLSLGDLIRINASEFGYATPKVDVRGVAFQESKILLVREIADDGKWTLPGGWADVNESPSEAVVREVLEESGFETDVIKLLAVYDREKQMHIPPFPYHVYKIFFLCEITGGEAKINNEVSEVAFFGEDEIPELSDSRVKKEQIGRFFRHNRKRDLPTEFD
ncbi:MAG: NUDIX hydrolase [Candidatus Omnitrophica bacterium]|nr:NUDIX hydrolase [Candidatus Omnitrophota bacterium]